MDAPRCTEHPTAAAPWHCASCERLLCPACAAPGAAAGVVVCTRCGHLVDLTAGVRAEVAPYRATLAAARRPLWRPLGLVIGFILTVVSLYLAQWSPQSWIAGQVLLLAWFALLLRRSAVGLPAIDVPNWDDFGESLLGTLPRLLPLLGPPAVLAAIAVHFGERALRVESWLGWGLAAVILLVMPPALVIASIEGPGSGVATPWRLPRIERALGRDLWPLRGLVALWVGLELGCAWLAPLDFRGDMSLFTHEVESFIPHLAANLVFGAIAVSAGHPLFTHAAAFDHGEAHTAQIPYLPGVAPTGVWTRPVDVAAEAARAVRHQPLELEDPAAQLLAAIDAGDAAQSVARLRRGGVSTHVLAPEQMLALAQMLAGQGAPAEAAALLRDLLARSPAHPVIPRATIVLARLCAERLDAADEARRLYQSAIERFPGTDAARFAAQRLAS